MYVHRWPTPIKLMLFGVVENWYYAPSYNPKLLPVPLYCRDEHNQKFASALWYANHDGFWTNQHGARGVSW